MLTRLETAGIGQVIAFDLSQPAFPVSAVRVIIPGLEGVCTMPTYTPGARASASHD
jgi:ribosomal protein S12 methylthiotransferase accessory factor